MSSKASLILKSSGFRVLQTLIGMVIGLLMMPFLIKVLGQEHYGLWIVIGSVVGTYYLLDLGFNQAVTRYVSRYIHQNNPDGANRIINTALVIYSLLGVVVLLISIIAAHYGAGKLMEDKSDLDLVKILLIISGLSLALEFPAKSFPGIISAYMRYDFIALVRLLKSIIDALLIYFFLSNGYGLIAMALVTLVTGLISTAIYIRFTTGLFKELKFSRSHIDLGTAKDVFHFSKWVFVLDVNTMLRNKMDIWFIAFFQSSGILTVYYVAVRLVEYAISFLTQATGFSTPIFTEHHAKGNSEKLGESFNLFIKFNIILGFVFINGFVLLGYAFIQLWMGESFPAWQAYICLLIITAGRFSSYFSAHFQSMLMTMNRHSISAWVALVESALMLVLLIILTPRYGIVGASMAVAIPMIIGRLLVVPYCTSRIVDFSIVPLFLRVITFSGVSAGVGIAVLLLCPELKNIGWLQLIMAAPLVALSHLFFVPILFSRREILLITSLIFNRTSKFK